MTKCVKALLLASAALTLPNAVFAQETQEQPQATGTSGGIREIVVTARRTAENQQDVPISITALDPTALDDRQILEVADIGRAAAGLSVQSGGTGNASLIYLAIRGNAQNSPNSLSDPAVGIYVDGVYYARPIAGNNGLLDLGSVEVLRGTQGTLFGRNTTGGALNMTTLAPSSEFEGYVKASVGTYETWSLESSPYVSPRGTGNGDEATDETPFALAMPLPSMRILHCGERSHGRRMQFRFRSTSQVIISRS